MLAGAPDPRHPARGRALSGSRGRCGRPGAVRTRRSCRAGGWRTARSARSTASKTGKEHRPSMLLTMTLPVVRAGPHRQADATRPARGVRVRAAARRAGRPARHAAGPGRVRLPGPGARAHLLPARPRPVLAELPPRGRLEDPVRRRGGDAATAGHARPLRRTRHRATRADEAGRGRRPTTRCGGHRFDQPVYTVGPAAGLGRGRAVLCGPQDPRSRSRPGQEALEEVGQATEPAYVARLGTVDVRGIEGGTEHAERAIKYATKYLTKDLADQTLVRSDPQKEHVERLRARAARPALLTAVRELAPLRRPARAGPTRPRRRARAGGRSTSDSRSATPAGAASSRATGPARP